MANAAMVAGPTLGQVVVQDNAVRTVACSIPRSSLMEGGDSHGWDLREMLSSGLGNRED